MIDSRNNGNIQGTLVADPEALGENGNMYKLRLAVDYAANDRTDPNNKTAFLNAVAYSDNPNLKFMIKQIQEGNLKKGSTVQVLYRLMQNRWKNEQTGSVNSAIQLVIEGFNYAGGKSSSGNSSSAASAAPAANTSVPEGF